MEELKTVHSVIKDFVNGTIDVTVREEGKLLPSEREALENLKGWIDNVLTVDAGVRTLHVWKENYDK